MKGRKHVPRLATWLLPIMLTGCAVTIPNIVKQELPPRAASVNGEPPLRLSALVEQELPPPRAVSGPPRSAAPDLPSTFALDDLIRLSLDQNPALRQAGLDIDAARGRAIQAGLYPNPHVGVNGEEIGRQGGIHTFPLVSQEIVTGGKLRLSRMVADRQVDQATLGLLRQRYVLLTTVRQGYFEVLALQRRVEVLTELERLAKQAYENGQKLRKAEEIHELDLLPLQVELERLRADLDASQREKVAAWQRLAANIGLPTLPLTPVAGSLELPLPKYDFEQARTFMLEEHPEVQSARVGITRAQLALKREEVEPIPNVTLAGGYTQNFNERQSQAQYTVSVPIPVFNRNQGNIFAAKTELARAVQEVSRVQNDVAGRLATAYGQYTAAHERAERYRTSILPNARRTYQLSLDAFKGGQFEYLRVVQAQRMIAEANLEYTRALGDAWRAASEIAGLLLEEHWPTSGIGICEKLPDK